jgi:hypothetical protein
VSLVESRRRVTDTSSSPVARLGPRAPTATLRWCSLRCAVARNRDDLVEHSALCALPVVVHPLALSHFTSRLLERALVVCTPPTRAVLFNPQLSPCALIPRWSMHATLMSRLLLHSLKRMHRSLWLVRHSVLLSSRCSSPSGPLATVLCSTQASVTLPTISRAPPFSLLSSRRVASTLRRTCSS